MKTTILAMLLILTTLITFGQKTEYGSYSLIGSKEKIVTSFISFDGNLGNLTNEFKFTDKMIGTVGCTLGSTIDHAITIGLTGSYYFDTPISKFQNFGYVGGLIEPTIFGKFPFHITFPCVIGVYGSMQEDDYWKLLNLILISGVRMELNIADGLRVSCGPSYKWIPDQNAKYMSLDFSIKIGKY